MTLNRLVLTVTLVGFGLFLAWAPLGVPASKTIQEGLIVPHHLLVKDWMERFYEEQGLRYPPSASAPENSAYPTSIERIILLSPNHFGYGYDWIQSTDIQPGQDIIPGQDVWPANLPATSVTLDGRSIYRLSLNGAISIEPSHFYKEHGITAEFPYLERFFWGATILPITFKEGTPQPKLDALVEELIKLQQQNPRETLVIASIDFTHMEEEKYALENDNRTIEFLQSVSTDGPPTLDQLRTLALTTNPAPLPGAVAMDSPETLYVLLQLMAHAAPPSGQEADKSRFTLWQRTSSTSLIPGLPPKDNTSHIFGSF